MKQSHILCSCIILFFSMHRRKIYYYVAIRVEYRYDTLHYSYLGCNIFLFISVRKAVVEKKRLVEAHFFYFFALTKKVNQTLVEIIENVNDKFVHMTFKRNCERSNYVTKFLFFSFLDANPFKQKCITISHYTFYFYFSNGSS